MSSQPLSVLQSVFKGHSGRGSALYRYQIEAVSRDFIVWSAKASVIARVKGFLELILPFLIFLFFSHRCVTQI